jgi:hypothetical protein
MFKKFKQFRKEKNKKVSKLDPNYNVSYMGFIKKKPRPKGLLGRRTKIDEGMFADIADHIQDMKHNISYSGGLKNHIKNQIADFKLVRKGKVLAKHYNYQNQEHRKAIKDYTDRHFTLINNHLYQQTGKKPIYPAYHSFEDNSPEYHKQVNRIDSNLSTALQQHKTKEDMTVYTGVKESPERHYKEGETHIKLQNPAYTSTSLDKRTANQFADTDSKSKYHHSGYTHIIKLHIPKGAHGGYVDHESVHDGEHEFLLHKNAKFHINPTPEIDHKKWHVMWHGKLVHDGIKDV